MGLRSTNLNRREFLRQSMMSSAVVLAAGGKAEASDHADLIDLDEPALNADRKVADPHSHSFAAFHELTPGSVKPEGWLRLYLEKQAANLASELPKVSWPFTGAFWSGEEQAESWWPWEQKAYWIDGAARLALVLDDRQLMDKVEPSLRYTLDHAGTDGYLGPTFLADPKGEYHRWPHTVFFRALTACYDAGLHPEALEAIRKHYLGDHADYGKPSRNVTNVENILWCYERTGDQRLLDMATKAWSDFSKINKPGENPIDLSDLRVFSAAPINMHGVNYVETAKQPAILYSYTGDTKYLEFAEAAQRRIFDHHMLIDGTPSTSEFYRTLTSLDSHETCCTTDHTWTWGYMLMATGQGVWADRVERACFNAGFGAIKKDWKALQYFSCPNQVLGTMNSDHNVLFWTEVRAQDGGAKMAFQPNPGQNTACCGGNVHRLFPNYVIRMWMLDTNGGIAAMLYGPSRLKTRVGRENQEVEIVQDTDYPFGEQISFTIKMTQPLQFPLSFRVPEWCGAPSMAINGRPTTLPKVRNGFVKLDRQFHPEDKVTLVFPMKLAVSHWPQHGIGLERGPLVYSLPIKEDWKPIVEPKYTTEEFPAWNVHPASAWNYALDVDPSRLDRQVRIQQKAMTQDPWVDPPISLTVPVRSVKHWALQENPNDPTQFFTPPLPKLNAGSLDDSLEQITLSPYGSTHLRVTVFPNARST